MSLAILKKLQDKRSKYAAAREAAKEVLAEFGSLRPPIDPEAIAEELGINVVYVNFGPDVSGDISGLYDFEGRKIYVNREIPVNRKTFTIAHELAHAVMHEEYVKSNAYRAMPRMNSYANTDKPIEEIQADIFAANLLVPKDILRSYLNYADIEELAEMFSVSEDVIRNQIRYI